MIRTHTTSARRGLTLALAAALVSPTTPARAAPAADAPADDAPAADAPAAEKPAAEKPAAEKPAAEKPASKPSKPSKPASKPSKPSKPSTPDDGPDAGDGNIPEELEPGQLGRSYSGTETTEAAPVSTGSATRATGAPRNRASVEVGLDLSDQADKAFDAGDFATAARLYGKALDLLSENQTNHMTRSVVLANAVTAYQQLFATTNEINYLLTGQRILQEYLRACKTKHGTGCERYAETQEARARLLQITKDIETAAPTRMKIPPEIGSAPGGKPYDLTVDLPPPPAWIAPAIVGGIALAGGGAALIYYAATADKYGPIYDREGEDTTTDGTTDDTSGDTDGTDTSTGSTSDITLDPDTKGKLLIGVGAFLAAAGIGFTVLGAMRLAKHRRINRERAQTLAIVPSFGRHSAGLALTGRF